MRGPEGPRIFIIKLTNKLLVPYITRRRKTKNKKERVKRDGQISSGTFGTLAAHGKVVP